MTDREVQCAILDAIGALAIKLTGERLIVRVETEAGVVRMRAMNEGSP